MQVGLKEPADPGQAVRAGSDGSVEGGPRDLSPPFRAGYEHSRATFWYWAFNEFPQLDFSEERLVQGMEQYLLDNGIPAVASHSLRKDARCFLRTYLPPARDRARKTVSKESPGLPSRRFRGAVRDGLSGGQYRFAVGQHRSLSLELFAYALYRFRERVRPGETVLALEELRWAPLSPGRVLCLENRALLELLEELEQRTAQARLIRTAGLNMVTLDADVRSADVLEDFYARREAQHG